jgi:hypothetical protein
LTERADGGAATIVLDTGAGAAHRHLRLRFFRTPEPAMSQRPPLCLALAAFAALAAPAPAAAPSPQVVRPDPDENLQWAASVVQISELRRQGDLGAKLFGTSGGDPAMNGLYTYLAFFDSAGDGWRVFRLGDFLSCRVVAETRGRLTLEIRESVMDGRTGNIGERTRRLLVSWRPGAGDGWPETVSLAETR